MLQKLVGVNEFNEFNTVRNMALHYFSLRYAGCFANEGF